MEGFYILLAAWIILGPTILAIVAMTQVASLRNELALLRKRSQEHSSPPAKKPPIVAAPPPPQSAPETFPFAVAKPVDTPPPPPGWQPPKQANKPSLELTLGGKAFSYIGIVALLFGVAFFIIYSAKMGWISDGVRVLMGIVSGTILIGLGHKAETTNKNLALLARALTGGGCALFYFSVYAAFNFYHIISPFTTLAGLVVAAFVALSLSVVYRSQAVALLGVLGGFITPLLINDPAFYSPSFILTYVAVLNVPVIALGLKRNWQALYNCAMGITLFHSIGWLWHQQSDMQNWPLGLFFFTLYFLQFTALGLFKLSIDRSELSKNVDIGRMLLASVALIAAVWHMIHQSGHQSWVGFSLLCVAILHLLLIHLARKRVKEYKHEILALLLGGLTAICFALPAQLDGVWVSLGWALEGMLIVRFAASAQSPILAAAGILLGLIGLGKSMFFDYTLPRYADEYSALILNPRFISALACNALFALQGRFLNRMEMKREKSGTHPVDVMLTVGLVGGLISIFTDSFIHWGQGPSYAWLTTSVAMLLLALIFMPLAKRNAFPILSGLCTLLLLSLPFKILFADTFLTQSWYHANTSLILNPFFLLQLALLCLVFAQGLKGPLFDWRLTPELGINVLVKALSMLCAVMLITQELYRGPWSSDTRHMAITLWWVISALAMVSAGLLLRHPYLRFISIFLFLITILKVFLVDLADLADLQRIAAFMVLGVVLLLVSYAYQRIAPRLIQESSSDESNKTSL